MDKNSQKREKIRTKRKSKIIWHVSKTDRVFFRFFILINGLPIHIFFLIFLINYYTRMFDLSYSGIGCLKKILIHLNYSF